MIHLLEFIFASSWHFLGVCFIGAFLVKCLVVIWSRFMRMLMVRKHGWPPPHLDADGDWKEESD